MRAIEYIKDLKLRLGTPYIYGAKQNKAYNKVINKSNILSLQKTYGLNYVWATDLSKSGGFCCDCSGFIDYLFQCGYNSSALKNKANSVIKIRLATGKLDYNNLYKVPLGSILWCDGHVGVFIGFDGKTPYYIAQDGSKYNCRINKLIDSPFTHALYYISGYDIDYYIPKKFKTLHRCLCYNSNDALLKTRELRKGTIINAVARCNNMVLLRKYGKNMNEWVSIRDLVEVKK